MCNHGWYGKKLYIMFYYLEKTCNIQDDFISFGCDLPIVTSNKWVPPSNLQPINDCDLLQWVRPTKGCDIPLLETYCNGCDLPMVETYQWLRLINMVATYQDFLFTYTKACDLPLIATYQYLRPIEGCDLPMGSFCCNGCDLPILPIPLRQINGCDK